MTSKNIVRMVVVVSTLLGLSACGGGGGGDIAPPPTYTTQIQSDPAFDGDIALTGPNAYVVTQGMTSAVQSVFAGIDPVTSNEYRAFLDFPLGGSNGVPANAVIDSAYLDIYISSLQPTNGSLPLRIELVAFQPPTLIGTDFDVGAQPALAYIQVSQPITGGEVATNISIDVTSLMFEAQRQQLTDFQLRVMEDLGPAVPVIMEINDTTGSNRADLAPLLTVTYE